MTPSRHGANTGGRDGLLDSDTSRAPVVLLRGPVTMGAITKYPTEGDPLVAGAPWAIEIEIEDETDPPTTPATFEPRDLTGTHWRCQIRATKRAPLVAEFDIDPPAIPEGGTVPNLLILRLDAEDTALVRDGMKFELEQLDAAPTPDSDDNVIDVPWIATLRVTQGVTRD